MLPSNARLDSEPGPSHALIRVVVFSRSPFCGPTLAGPFPRRPLHRTVTNNGRCPPRVKAAVLRSPIPSGCPAHELNEGRQERNMYQEAAESDQASLAASSVPWKVSSPAQRFREEAGGVFAMPSAHMMRRASGGKGSDTREGLVHRTSLLLHRSPQREGQVIAFRIRGETREHARAAGYSHCIEADSQAGR